MCSPAGATREIKCEQTTPRGCESSALCEGAVNGSWGGVSAQAIRHSVWRASREKVCLSLPCPSEPRLLHSFIMENGSFDLIDLHPSGELYLEDESEEELLLVAPDLFEVKSDFCKSRGDTAAILGSLSHILNNLFAGHLSC